jgi:hypothetical protein
MALDDQYVTDPVHGHQIDLVLPLGLVEKGVGVTVSAEIEEVAPA